MTLNNYLRDQFKTIFLGLIFIIGLTGCAQPAETPVSDAGQPVSAATIPADAQVVDPTATPGSAEVVAEPEFEPVVDLDVYAAADPAGQNMVFWHTFSGREAAALQQIVADFNAANQWGITVATEAWESDAELTAAMAAVLNTDQTPDLVLVKYDQAMQYQYDQALIDLNDLYLHETWGFAATELDDFYLPLLEQGVSPMFDQARLSFPIYAWMDVLFYNIDWLQQLEYENPPTFPGAFLEMACAAALQPFGRAEVVDRTGYELVPDAARFADWSLTFGGKAYNPGIEQYNFGSAAILDGMTYLQNMMDRQCARPVTQSGDEIENFGKGVALFAIASTNQIAEIRASVENGVNFNWRVAPLPYTAAEPVMNVDLASLSIPKSTPETQLAAWLFIQHFTSPEIQAYWSQSTDYLAVRSSAGRYLAGTPAFMTSQDLLKYGVTETMLPGYAAVQDMRQHALRLIADGTDVQVALDQLTESANLVLAEQLEFVPEIPDPWAAVDPSGQTIVFWHNHLEARNTALEEIIAAFNQTNPWGITAVAENKGGYSDIFYAVLPLIGTPDMPNLIVGYPFHAAAYYQSDGLVNLSGLIDSPTWGLAAEDREDFFTNVLQQDVFPTYNNARLGFPVQRSVDLLYYNADWLAALEISTPPQTPEDFAEIACLAAQTPYIAGSETSTGYQIYPNASRLADWAFGFGVDYFNENDGLYEFNSPEMLATLTFLQTLIQDECARANQDRIDVQAAFVNGESIFMIESSAQLETLEAQIAAGANFSWDILPIPHQAENPALNAFGASLSILKTTPEQELATWLLIQHLTSSEMQAKWSAVTGFMPVRAGASDFLNDQFAAAPKFETIFNWMVYTQTEPSLPGYDFVRQEMENTLLVVLDGADADELLDYLDSSADQILAGY